MTAGFPDHNHRAVNMSPTEDRPARRTRLEATRRLGEIAEGILCIGCGDPMRRAHLNYAFSYTANGAPAEVWSDQVAGYQCDHCDLQFYELAASVDIQRAALHEVRESHDKFRAKQLVASIAAGEEQIARSAQAL